MLKKLYFSALSVFFLLLFFVVMPKAAHAFNYSLSANPTYSCDSTNGQWNIRWSWSGPSAPGTMQMNVYLDSVAGAYNAEAQVASHPITVAESTSGFWDWSLPLANQQYVGVVEFFGQQSITVAVVGTASPCASPTADIKANGSNGPITITSGTSATISWTSTNTTSCSVSPGGWTGTSGSQSSGAISSTLTYTLSCNGFGSSAASDTVTINVSVPPTVTLSASPNPVAYGGAATLTWTISNATSCTGTNMPAGNWSTGGSDAVGVSTGALTGNTTYTLNCTGTGGSASSSVTVNVTPLAPYQHGCQADFNGDGVINGTDLTMFNNAYNPSGGNTTKNPTSPGTKDPIYDLNGDYVLNTIDVLIMNQLVNLNYTSCLPLPPPPTPPPCSDGSFGSTLNFPWVWKGSGLLSFDIKISDTATYIAVTSKNVTGGALSTTGASGWTGPLTSAGVLSLAPSTEYYWSVRATTNGGTGSYRGNVRINAVPKCSTLPVAPIPHVPPNNCIPSLYFNPTFSWSNPALGFVIEISHSNATSAVDGSYTGAKSSLTVTSGGLSATTGSETTWVQGLEFGSEFGGSITLYAFAGDFYWHIKNTNGAVSSAWVDGPTIFSLVGFCAPQNIQVVVPNCAIDNYGSVSSAGKSVAQIQADDSGLFRFSWQNLSGLPPYLTFALTKNGGFPSPGLVDATSSLVTLNQWAGGLEAGATYYWTLQYYAGWSPSPPVPIVPLGSASGGFTVPFCPYHGLQAVQSYNPGFWHNSTCSDPAGSALFTVADLSACTKVRITNVSPAGTPRAQVADKGTVIGIWEQGVPAPPGPFVCNTTGLPIGKFSSTLASILPPTNSTTLGVGTVISSPNTSDIGLTVNTLNGLPAGATAEVTIPFTVPHWTHDFTGYVIADPGCTNDRELVNSVPGYTDNSKSITYRVAIDGFFDTNGGDVGAGGIGVPGNVTVSQSPPGAFKVSDYLIAAAGTLDSNATAPWRISGYGSHAIVPSGGVYAYMDRKFRAAAVAAAGANNCSGAYSSGFYICDPGGAADTLTLNGATYPTSTQAVVFVDGNLNIDSDYSAASPTNNGSVVFIVSGDVTVKGGNPAAVSNIDGIYIVGGHFKSGDGLGKLTINGGVYANFVDLTRTNDVDPSANPGEVINSYIKNVILFNTLLGTNSTVWQEVSP
jgi:hypothetical protein